MSAPPAENSVVPPFAAPAPPPAALPLFTRTEIDARGPAVQRAIDAEGWFAFLIRHAQREGFDVSAAYRTATRPDGSRYLAAQLFTPGKLAPLLARKYGAPEGPVSSYEGVSFEAGEAATGEAGGRARAFRVVAVAPTGAGIRAATAKFPEQALLLAVDAAGRPLAAEVPKLAALVEAAEAFAGANGGFRVPDALQADVERALGYAAPAGATSGALLEHRVAARAAVAARLAAHLREFVHETPMEAIRAGQARLEAAAAE
jgi:hypothetical protein